MSKRNDSDLWRALESTGRSPNLSTIKRLFEKDPERTSRMSAERSGIFLDFSRNHIEPNTLQRLMELCQQSHLSDQIAAMYAGKKINLTENRSVLHTALRNTTLANDHGLTQISFDVKESLKKIKIISDLFRTKQLKGATGKSLNTIINIGIGGSDLGPRLVYKALKNESSSIVHYVSNLDAEDLETVINEVDAERTLVIVTSKTFTTQETLNNANRALAKLSTQLKLPKDDIVRKQMIAITASPETAISFGITESNIFEFWDWVGGRFSVWSAVGLSLSMSLGFEVFEELLHGAHEMDTHFATAPYEKNIPVLLALVGIWNINFRKQTNLAVLPYSERLGLLPNYLQQLEMESNGKSVDRSGSRIDYTTSASIFGVPGTNFQHSFAQHLHQSPTETPCDFIGIVNPPHPDRGNANALLSHCLAQVECLSFGRQETSGDTKISAEREMPGDRPCNVILLKELNAITLGALLAAYEHKVFVQGVIWNINSFDQWGVELGKSLSKSYNHIFENDGMGDVSQRAFSGRLIEQIGKYRPSSAE